jgi:hypothetical protein
MGTDDNGYERAVCHQLGKAAKLRTGTRKEPVLSFADGRTRESRVRKRVPAEAGGGVYDRDPLRLDTVALPEIIFDAEPAQARHEFLGAPRAWYRSDALITIKKVWSLARADANIMGENRCDRIVA